jgi:hypothetical protein
MYYDMGGAKSFRHKKKKKKDKKTHYDTKQIPHASQFALLRIP